MFIIFVFVFFLLSVTSLTTNLQLLLVNVYCILLLRDTKNLDFYGT